MSNDVVSGVPAELARRVPGKCGIEESLGKLSLLHQGFELRATAEPEALALVVGEERVTCGELEARANQLARYLMDQGVGPETRVAICVERTAGMVIGLLAILKAGGAYIPIDPVYPRERQALILGDSGAALLLTQERLLGRLPEISGKTILLDLDGPQIGLRSGEPVKPLADPGNLAYVIYTSGSTGRPKGVAIEHRSAVALIRWAATLYSREELSGVLAATSICFDLSIFELFVTLALGGKVILADNALSLPTLPAAGEVTLVNTVPSAIAELLRSHGIPPSVRTFNLAGEALRGSLVQRLYEESGAVQKIYNLYGPSEDTTYSTVAQMERGDSRPPSIGWPIDGTWIYLLSSGLDQVPAEGPGELYLGGEGLARGYLNRPDLTAARFVPDPFSARPGERIYGTGDLARYRQDGELDYMGRIDHQVKIRGFRIELGEIEATLERHPSVADTVVVARELDESGEAAQKELVAYVVPAVESLPAPELRESLREYLLERLTAQMIPAHFVVLDALPRNPNGKVDRAALPPPEPAGERPGFLAPRTLLEATLAEIWSEVLSVPRIGLHDHFFELGGHSLLAARVNARIHEALGRRLPPRALFDAPTVERLAALLTDLLDEEELEGIPVAKDRKWVASAGQEAMWFSERLNPDVSLFTIPLMIDLEGPLDPLALKRSLAGIVRRHEVLRVVFQEVKGRPDIELSDVLVDLPRIDLRALPARARSGEVDRAAASLGGKRIDLRYGPLMQGYLVDSDELDHRLLITLHHIVGDDWSIGVLTHDLAAFYAAAVAGRQDDLPALPLQFSDYATWQREWLEGAEARKQLAFWKLHLPSSPDVLDLPTDRPRPATQSFRGAQVVDEIPWQDSQALLGLALRSRATLFMAFLAALDALLHRYSGQEDLTVGAPVANRHRTGTQNLIGLFTNTLILRTDFSAAPCFDELLQQVQETVLEGLGNQDFPFDRLVRELQPERSLSHAALAQVILSFQNTPALPAQLGPGLDLRLHELGNGAAKVDITLYVRQQGGTLVTVWEHASELFDASTIARMSGHFQRLLSAAIADPARRVSELPLLTAAEGEQIFRWSGERGRVVAECVHERFSVQAGRMPDVPAVRFESEVLTFGELDARSEALARRLRALGIGPERTVAVCVDRSLAMVVAVLGVMKAGGAYVPLDAESPRERLAFMLTDCGARVLLAQEALASSLPPFSGPVVMLTADGLVSGDTVTRTGAVADKPLEWEPGRLEHLAYVIYTSGSTGQPKGVMVGHRQLASYLAGVLDRMSLPEGASFATVSTLAADLGNTVIFASLVTGGCLHVISSPRISEAAALAEYCERHPVDCLKIVPSHLAALLSAPRAAGCLPRRLLIVGGEATSPGLVERIRELAPACRILNHYGPTETTVGVLTHEVERAPQIPLGKPLAGMRVLVLDRGFHPVPVGIPGELHVGGPQVTRGYLGRPDLTAEKFLPDPWRGPCGQPGSRLYATGDRGRYLADGSIEFLGRMDFQVKVRGFRVEPGEVEAVLRAHPGVAAAVVVARSQSLVAYVVANPQAVSPDAGTLRAFLKERLPDPLVPTAWVFLPALPLTPNGKVDRKALPPPEEARILPEAAAPRTPTERLLASLWTGVLGLDQVGIHENFFELGGHSLLAMQVVSRVRDSFGIELPVRRLFEIPTVAGLAEILDVEMDLVPVDRRGFLPASFVQESPWVAPRCLQDLFTAQAARSPEALAVFTPAGERLTYGEVDQRSSRLARFLVRQGMKPEMPVGVCLERSPELVIALLAVLKAGGIYLPLDPAYPAERLAFMLEDSGALLALTLERLAKEIPAGRWEIVSLDAADGPFGTPEDKASVPLPSPLPESLAYLIYTSGSTGRPKGVGVSHAPAAAHMEIASELFDLHEEDRVLWFASPSFDISMEEVLTPLSRGAAVVLRGVELWQPADLLDRVHKLGVTVMDLPTAYWHQWAADSERARLPEGLKLRLVILGGEAMSGEAARRWWRSPLAGTRLLNAYGPTEAIVTSAVLEVESEVAASAGGTIPIGRALAGRFTWVLDPFGRPVPTGVDGELCLGGPLLARGYLGRPDLTAERFVPDPFAGTPGARLYRTGDLARRQRNGNLEFRGRIDRQLKVRGFRVEPGEIESALARHSAVREVVVDARPDQGGSQRLLAWIVPAGQAPAPEDLAGFLHGTLPAHMVPSAFITIDELPLTPNGKVNLRALPDPEAHGERSREVVPPRTPTEERLAGLWRELLGLSRVGAEDDFFALGGHSLLAARLLARVHDVFGIDISLRALFSAPSLEKLAALIEESRPGPDLRAEPSPAAGRARGERPQHWPLSFSQQSLWFIDRLQLAGGAYNLPTAVRFTGDLDEASLAAALVGLVLRHEALRTRFVEVDGEAWQHVTPTVAPELPLIDLRNLPVDRREEEALRLARAEAYRPFDLTVGPLLRALLFRLAPGEHLFLRAVHHSVSDGWSDEILTRDLAMLYKAAVENRVAELPPLPMQFADFAVWQREHLRGVALEEPLAVWQRRLAGVPPLELPTDHRRPVVWSFRGASRTLPMNIPVAGLDRLARAHRATPFMLLLTNLQVLLGRYTGQDDFVVGTPSANRKRSELENVVGFFVNMLPLRAELSGAPTFSGLLARVRAMTLEAFSHQGIPFELLVEKLAPERDLGRNPIFQVAFQLTYGRNSTFPGLTVQPFDLGSSSAKFDLDFVVTQEGDRLVVACEYSADLYEDTTIQRLLGHFETLLAGVFADPDCRVGDLPLLTGAEREQLLSRFNDAGSTSGPEVCLHQLFEATVARVPDQVALIAPDERLTYRELNDRADRLAHRLRSLGLGPEALAGVLMDRTADLIVTLLAVHKSGGAYAPLDPNYPRQRVLLMLETSRAKVLVTRRHLAEALGEELPSGMRTVFLEPGWEEEATEELAVEAMAALPDNLAYVIFTSGSTGVPRGVAIQHRSAVAMIRWARAMYTPEEYAGLLASTSICFDMSVFEIFATLAEGGKLILAENALALPELAAKDEVVLVDTVPSAMAELLRLGGLPPSIRTVNLGGEPLKSSLVREIYEQLPNVERVVNLYGPSEDTTFSTFSVVPSDAEHPLIGRPLTGESTYVLDGEMRPVPIGIPGALYMGGEGVTRGYLNRPDLTAERYVPNPYGPPGSRLYGVGDLVRYLPSGELDFLGRLDHQVKVRGFRIELGEIESALTRHSEVRDAAVLASPDLLGSNRLIAYVETERDLAMGELRAFLKQSLPDYMVPSVFVPLRELPLTPNGKIDRRALAAMPLQPESVAVAGDRTPRSFAEEVLVGIWSEIFGHPVALGDNFFDLGGHSLMATRVVSRIRTALNVELPLQQIFTRPTLEGLVAQVERAIESQRAVPMPPITRTSSAGELPLSFAQQRLWFLDQLEPGTATFNLPAPLRLTGRLDVGALARTLDEIVRRHESLRTRFGERAGTGYQEVRPAAPVPLPWIDLSGLPAPEAEMEAEKWSSAEARRPFDLIHGPLLRTWLLQLGAEDWLLLVTMHHIVTDGWSTDLFARELRTLYEAFSAGLPSPLPELPLQYPDFAVWQRQALSGEAVEALLEDWKRRFGTEVPALRLPTDRPRPPVQTTPGAYRWFQLSAELTRALQDLAQRSGVTLFMTLLAAFQALLYRYSGQERIVVGSPVAGRNRPELEELIGFFVNTLVLPGDFSGGLTFRQILERSREMALGAYACQDLPFEKLVEALQPVRDNSRSPLFQVMFLLRQQAGDSPASGGSREGLHVEPSGAGTGTSQFDLTLFVGQTPEGFSGGVEYNTDLFDAGTMDRLLEHYRHLLAAAAADPEIRLADIPVPPLTETPQAWVDAGTAEARPEALVDARRDRLASRLSKLSAAQREAIERRLKGGS